MTNLPPTAREALPDRRLRDCVESWPEAETGAYDPRCCRFPKSCSATVYDEGAVVEADLEPVAATPAEHGGHDVDGRATAMEAAMPWLKARRDEYRPASAEWIALDGALDNLRDHYYTGTPLHEDVQGPWAEVDR